MNTIQTIHTNNNTLSWLEKYRPQKLADYYISKKQLDVVKEWIKDFRDKTEDAKPFLILHGSAGIGKTTLAYLILEYYNYEIIECNASDTRTKKTIQETLGQISKVSVCMDDNDNFKETAILMDEIDGLNGGEFNSVQELIDIITKDKDTKTKKNICPVVCTCNSIKNKKLQLLMKYSVVLHINKPSNNDCKKLIQKISTLEKFSITEQKIEEIVEKSFGDYRQIIILLYEFYNTLKTNKLQNKIPNDTPNNTPNNIPYEIQINNEIPNEIQINNEIPNEIQINNKISSLKLNNYEDEDAFFTMIKKINNECETPLEKINYILTNYTKLQDIETISNEDANIYYMNFYINVIPIIYELQLKKKNNVSKEDLLFYYKKLISIYDLLKSADLMNNKIFIDKEWECLEYFECIGIALPLQLLYNMNIKHSKIIHTLNNYYVPKFMIQHHSQYNFMRQEQTLIRKKINTDYTLSFETDLFSIYYYIKRFKHNNKEDIEKTLLLKKKRKTGSDTMNQKYLINRLYERIIDKIDELLS